ncbi:unnamed protein product, partial [Mesorhabditis spiculigera]
MRQRAEKTAAIFLNNLRKQSEPPQQPVNPNRRYKRSKSVPAISHEPVVEDEDVIEVIKDTAWDGIKYLGSQSRSTRIWWMSVMITFLCIAIYQILEQVQLYRKNPISTNIDVDYPKTVNFPVVAICNNNKFRLSYLAGLHGKLKSSSRQRRNTEIKGVLKRSKNPFDQVLYNHADADAVTFLNQASHHIDDILVKCVLPNGTLCSSSDFYPMWTVEGLCWAINIDAQKPISVNGAGPLYGLQLLLNVESYERINSPHLYFHSTALPGFKILAFNQTDFPISTSDAMNVPPGFTTYLPLSLQEYSKLESTGCRAEGDAEIAAREGDYFSPQNAKGCKARRIAERVERKCDCSMRGLHADFLRNAFKAPEIRNCTVADFFGCAREVIIEDLNRLPTDLMPSGKEDILTEDEEELDEPSEHKSRPNIYDTIDEEHAESIKSRATVAYEAQQKYQVDIAERFHRLIKNVQNAKLRLFAAKWGWNPQAFTGVYQRITERHPCIKNITNGYKDIVMYFALPSNRPEEYRAQLLLKIVDPETHKIDPKRYKSLAQVRNAYGEKMEPQRQELLHVLRMSKELWTAFNEVTYAKTIVADLTEMDRILANAEKLENAAGIKEWAEEMNSPDMQFFVNEEFNSGWYKTIFDNLDTKLVKTLRNVMKNLWPKHKKMMAETTSYLRTATILILAGEDSEQNKTYVRRFYEEMDICMKEVNISGVQILSEFKTLYKKWNSAYTALFKTELGKVLDKFEFNDDFERENFALVNIYINKMAVEKWSQEPTYSVWSLLSDVGGSLGLFLGASLISLMELIYIFLHFGGRKFGRTMTEKPKVQPAEMVV